MHLVKGIFLASIIILSSCNKEQVNKYDLKFENTVPDWLVENKVPAVGIGIIEDGSIKYTKVFGELKEGFPAPDNTIFNIASLTKPVVSMLTLKLVDAGEWNLDEPLYHYWIDPDIRNDSLTKILTTRHVLNHQTGFANWRRIQPSGKLSFEFAPGTDYKYSGEGFEYLKCALENKFGLSLTQLSDSILFKPLDMVDTHFSWDLNMDESRFALWHNYKGKPYKNSGPNKNGGVNAAGSLLTTIEDYCKFGVDAINGAGLSEDILKDMIRYDSYITKSFKQGLSWEIITDLPKEEYALVHKGTDNGVNTIVILMPESKRGVIVFSNGDNGGSVSEKVIKESLGEETYDAMFRIPNLPKIITLSNEILEKYVGEYIDHYGRGLEISISKEAGAIKVAGDGIGTSLLYPMGEAKFFNPYSELRYQFIIDSSGLVIKLNKLFGGKISNRAMKTN